ncbi:uncharacterized protein L199_000481 [Kwoniella botswanensis]|uniref:uncharacterized protein n=1 Tax=Kwoniella botswanensis TaxID=1268659 RepID=UPI00315DB740
MQTTHTCCSPATPAITLPKPTAESTIESKSTTASLHHSGPPRNPNDFIPLKEQHLRHELKLFKGAIRAIKTDTWQSWIQCKNRHDLGHLAYESKERPAEALVRLKRSRRRLAKEMKCAKNQRLTKETCIAVHNSESITSALLEDSTAKSASGILTTTSDFAIAFSPDAGATTTPITTSASTTTLQPESATDTIDYLACSYSALVSPQKHLKWFFDGTCSWDEDKATIMSFELSPVNESVHLFTESELNKVLETWFSANNHTWYKAWGLKLDRMNRVVTGRTAVHDPWAVKNSPYVLSVNLQEDIPSARYQLTLRKVPKYLPFTNMDTIALFIGKTRYSINDLEKLVYNMVNEFRKREPAIGGCVDNFQLVRSGEWLLCDPTNPILASYLITVPILKGHFFDFAYVLSSSHQTRQPNAPNTGTNGKWMDNYPESEKERGKSEEKVEGGSSNQFAHTQVGWIESFEEWVATCIHGVIMALELRRYDKMFSFPEPLMDNAWVSAQVITI